MSGRPLTPKEASAACDGWRSPRWFAKQCARFIRTGGTEGIRTLTGRPYSIPRDEVARIAGSEAVTR